MDLELDLLTQLVTEDQVEEVQAVSTTTQEDPVLPVKVMTEELLVLLVEELLIRVLEVEELVQ